MDDLVRTTHTDRCKYIEHFGHPTCQHVIDFLAAREKELYNLQVSYNGVMRHYDALKEIEINLRAMLAERDKELEEARVQLGAWHKIFGTQQLTHAADRLETAERQLAALREELEQMTTDRNGFGDMCQELEARNARLVEALEFYADPGTYFAIGFFPDPPCGQFVEDFEETKLGNKPGKRARQALASEKE